MVFYVTVYWGTKRREREINGGYGTGYSYLV
jgi:hypothetical protein